MEAQYIPPGDPQVRRRPKPNPRDPAAVVQQQGPQVVQNQQPHPRKTNRAELQQQPAQGFADPHYHGNVQQYGSAGLQVEGFEGSGYGVAQADGHGYNGYDVAQVDYAPTGHGYGGDQGQVQELGRVRPTQPGKKVKNKKPNSQPAAEGVHPDYGHDQQGGYENQQQWGGYDQQLPVSYEVGYGNQCEVEGYNQPVQGNYADGGYTDPVPGQQQPKREKSHKPSKDKRSDVGELPYGGVDNGMVPPAGVKHKERKKSKQSSEFPGNPTHEVLDGSPRAVSHALVDHYGNRDASGRSDGSGSGRSRVSQDGSLHGQSKASDRDPSGSGRARGGSNRVGDQRHSIGASRLGASVASNGGSNRLTADVLRSLDNNQPPIAPLTINSTTNDPTPAHAQDFSMIVFPGEKRDMETQIFDVPRGTKLPAVTEGPIYQRHGEHPLPQQRRPVENRHRPQPAPQGPYARTPVHHQQQQQQQQQTPSIYNQKQALVEYDAEGKQIQTVPEPNAKCIACVHTIGVPIARVGTRILCRSVCTGCVCTIL